GELGVVDLGVGGEREARALRRLDQVGPLRLLVNEDRPQVWLDGNLCFRREHDWRLDDWRERDRRLRLDLCRMWREHWFDLGRQGRQFGLDLRGRQDRLGIDLRERISRLRRRIQFRRLGRRRWLGRLFVGWGGDRDGGGK